MSLGRWFSGEDHLRGKHEDRNLGPGKKLSVPPTPHPCTKPQQGEKGWSWEDSWDLLACQPTRKTSSRFSKRLSQGNKVESDGIGHSSSPILHTYTHGRACTHTTCAHHTHICMHTRLLENVETILCSCATHKQVGSWKWPTGQDLSALDLDPRSEGSVPSVYPLLT